MIITNVRFTWLCVFDPRPDQSGRLKYSVQAAIPKTDTAMVSAIETAINAAVQRGIETGKFTAAQVKKPECKRALRDGDLEEKEALTGCWFLNASNDPEHAPGVVDEHARPVMDKSSVYSGMYGHLDVQFYPFSTKGNYGIACSLRNIMKTKDGDRLDGSLPAEQAFAQFAVKPGAGEHGLE